MAKEENAIIKVKVIALYLTVVPTKYTSDLNDVNRCGYIGIVQGKEVQPHGWADREAISISNDKYLGSNHLLLLFSVILSHPQESNNFQLPRHNNHCRQMVQRFALVSTAEQSALLATAHMR